MILELLEYLLTPCSRTARRLGFLKSSLQVRARQKRCRAAWASHLERTRSFILEAALLAERRRRAVLFGAGLLHDIPLRELSEMFEEVILADIVHTLPCRYLAGGYSNVRLLELDVTGVMAALPELRQNPNQPLPVSAPRAFVEDTALDFSVSVNLLSQLPWVPGQYLGGHREEAELNAMQRQLVEAHLGYLAQLPGHAALVTDVRWRAEPLSAGEHEREWDVLQGVPLPTPTSQWDWRIAPAPERERRADYTARVHAYSDWKASARECTLLSSP